MKNLSALSDAELLRHTHVQLERSRELDAELLLLLGEIDERRLFAERAYSSMFTFCVGELGFSEDVAYSRISAARLVRRFPRVLDFVRDGRLHLTGLRLLGDVLTEENLEEVLAAASRKSKRDIEQLVASLAPKPPVPPSIRKLPGAAPAVVEVEPPSLPLGLEPVTTEVDAAEEKVPAAAPAPQPLPPPRRSEVKPLSADTFKVEFTADIALKQKLEQAEELMRHRVGKGNLVAIIESAVDLLIAEVKKERFGVGRKPRGTVEEAEEREEVTRHVPAAIRREVYERDQGQCTFVSEDGKRCEERGGLELEHTEGFALTGRHAVAEMKLLCTTHNQLSADKLYGRTFMQRRRRGTRPGTGENEQLL